MCMLIRDTFLLFNMSQNINFIQNDRSFCGDTLSCLEVA